MDVIIINTILGMFIGVECILAIYSVEANIESVAIAVGEVVDVAFAVGGCCGSVGGGL